MLYMIPTGPTAWLTNKFGDSSDCDGDVEKRFTKDEPPTNITIW